MSFPTNHVVHLIATVGIAIFVQVTAFAGEEATVETTKYNVELIGTTECCPTTLHFSLRDKHTGQLRDMTVSGRVQEVREFFVVEGTRLVVVGELPWGGTIFLIANIDKNLLEETIWSFNRYAFSQSRRYLLYKTHHPRMTTAGGRRSILLLYDLTKGPEDNRIGEGTDYPRANAGLPVYPEINALTHSYDIYLDPYVRYVSPFLWWSDETKVVFLECDEAWESYALVVLDLRGGPGAPNIWRRPVDMKPFRQASGPWRFAGEETEPVRINVDHIEATNHGSVILRLPKESRIIEAIEFHLP